MNLRQTYKYFYILTHQHYRYYFIFSKDTIGMLKEVRLENSHEYVVLSISLPLPSYPLTILSQVEATAICFLYYLVWFLFEGSFYLPHFPVVNSLDDIV